MRNSNSVPISSQRINRCPSFNCGSMSALKNAISYHYNLVLRHINNVVESNVDSVKYKVRGFDEKHHCFLVTVWLPFFKDGKVCNVKCNCNVNQGMSTPNYPFSHNPFNSFVIADCVLDYFGLPLTDLKFDLV